MRENRERERNSRGMRGKINERKSKSEYRWEEKRKERDKIVYINKRENNSESNEREKR